MPQQRPVVSECARKAKAAVDIDLPAADSGTVRHLYIAESGRATPAPGDVAVYRVIGAGDADVRP